MGGNHSEIIYSVPISEKKEGETAIYRNTNVKQNFAKLSVPELNTLQDVFLNGVKNFPNDNLIGTRNPKNGNKYEKKSFLNVEKICNKIGSGILNLNLEKKVKEENYPEMELISIFSKNREEWLFLDFACVLYNLTMVPLYDTLGQESTSFILNQTEVKSIFCSIQGLENLLKISDLGKIENIISFDFVEESLISKIKERGLKFYTMNEVIENGEKKLQTYRKCNSENIFTFSYTSGTTGLPKGALMSHKNMISTLISFEGTNMKILRGYNYLSYLPLPHILERLAVWNCIFKSCCVNFYGGDVLKLKEDIAEVKPDFFVSVPRLYNKFFDVIKGKMAELTGFKKFLSDKATSAKMYYLENGTYYNHRVYDKLVFSKTKAAFGGNCKFMVTGSAPISNEVIDFLKIACSCPIYEGYGSTETSGASFVTASSFFNEFFYKDLEFFNGFYSHNFNFSTKKY